MTQLKGIKNVWLLKTTPSKKEFTTKKLSLVIWFTSIRLLLVIAEHLNLELHQMDMKTTFLSSELDKEIFMQQPMRFVVQGQENKVCNLQHFIYGIK